MAHLVPALIFLTFTPRCITGTMGVHQPAKGSVMSSEVMLSYSHGASGSALLGETIGTNLRRIAAAHPRAEVLVDAPTGD